MDLNWIDQDKFAKVTQITARKYREQFEIKRARTIAIKNDERRISERLRNDTHANKIPKPRSTSYIPKREEIKIRPSLVPSYVFYTYSK